MTGTINFASLFVLKFNKYEISLYLTEKYWEQNFGDGVSYHASTDDFNKYFAPLLLQLWQTCCFTIFKTNAIK